MENNKSILKNLIWKYAERILAQIVTLVVSVVLARLLMPDDYGAISMVMVFITIAQVFVTGGFGNALIQKKDADILDFSSVFYFNMVFSVLIYIIIFFFAPYIAGYYDYPILVPVLRVLSIGIIIAGVNSVQHAYVSKHMMFKRFFVSSLFGTIISGVLGISLAYKGLGLWALVAQHMTNSAIDTLVLWFTVRWRPILSFSWVRIKGLLSYGSKILFEALSTTIIGQLRNLIIGKVYTSSDLGLYTKAQQIPHLLITNISQSMSSVLFPAMSLQQDDELYVKSLLRKAVVMSSYILFPMLTGLAVVSKPLVTLLLTEKWLESVPYMQIFCFTYAATIGMIPRHQALKAIGRSDVFMQEHIVVRVVGIILLISVFRISVMAIALSGIASSIILTLTVMYTSKRFNHYAYKEQIADVLPTLALCVCMGVPVYFIQFIEMSNMFILCIQVVTGVLIFVGLSILFKPKGYKLSLAYVMPIIDKLRKWPYRFQSRKAV